MASPLYPLVDRILDGRLAAELTTRRQRGDSYQRITTWLAKDHDIEVTSETVRNWCRDIDITEATAS